MPPIRKLENFLGPGIEFEYFNYAIYIKFFIDSDISNLFTPVEFFEIAHSEYIFFFHHNKNYQEITDRFSNLGYDTPRLYHIFYYLSSLIKIDFSNQDKGTYYEIPNDDTLKSCIYINRLFKDITINFGESEKGTEKVIGNSDNDETSSWNINITGLNKQELCKKFLESQYNEWKKKPLEGIKYHNWLINKTTTEKDNYILTYEKLGLNQIKIHEYDFKIKTAKIRLIALEQLINDTGSHNIAENSYNYEKQNKATLAIFEKQNQLIDKFQFAKTLSKEDIESGSYPNFTEGQQIKINRPIPNDPKEAFQLFKDYYAAFQCETHKSIFFDTYRSFENENAINTEIKLLQDFIKISDTINYFDACKNLNNPDPHYEYKRLTCDFYDDYLMTWEQHSLYSNAASVYGKYVLFYEFLKKILINNNRLSKTHLITTNNNSGFDRIDIDPKTNNLPIEIWSIYQSDYLNDTARFTEFIGEDISFVIEGDIMKRFLTNVENGRFYNEQLEILNIETIQHHFKFFSRGFLEGYLDFDEIINNQTAIFKNDFKSIANKVFEFVSNPWEGFAIGLKFSNGTYLHIIKEETMIESGVKAGHYYKAWYYVINNPQYFSELFKGHAPFISHYRSALKYYEQQSFGKEISLSLNALLKSIKLPMINGENKMQLSLGITNNFDGVKIEDVYNHFYKGLVEKQYLPNSTLINYLKSAFEQKIPPVEPFKFVNISTKQKIISVFYSYYKNVASKPHGKQKLYASLLGNYFEGYKTENVRTNFNK